MAARQAPACACLPSLNTPQSRAFVNLLKSFLGIGLLAYPYAFSLVGVPLAVLGTLLCIVVVRFSMRLLLYADDLLELRGGTALKRTLPVMATATLGPATGAASSWGFWVAMPTIVASQAAACVSYVAFIASNVTQVAPAVPRWAAVAATTSVLFPLTLPRRMDRLWAYSLLGVCGLIAGLIAAGVYCAQHAAEGAGAKRPADLLAVHWGGLASFLGIALFAIEGITAVPSVRYALARGLRRHAATASASAPPPVSAVGTMACLLDVCLAAIGSTTLAVGFGLWLGLPGAPDSVFTNSLEPTPAATAARAALAAYILFTFPLQLFPLVEAIEDAAGWGELEDSDDDESDDVGLGAFNGALTSGAGRIDADLICSSGSYDWQKAAAADDASDDGADPLDLPPHRSRRLRAEAAPASTGQYRPPVPSSALDTKRGPRGGAGCCSRRSTCAPLPFRSIALRGLLLGLVGIAAALTERFATVLSFSGWLCFGVLNFLLPPLMYLVLVQAHYSDDELHAGLHNFEREGRLRLSRAALPPRSDTGPGQQQQQQQQQQQRDASRARGASGCSEDAASAAATALGSYGGRWECCLLCAALAREPCCRRQRQREVRQQRHEWPELPWDGSGGGGFEAAAAAAAAASEAEGEGDALLLAAQPELDPLAALASPASAAPAAPPAAAPQLPSSARDAPQPAAQRRAAAPSCRCRCVDAGCCGPQRPSRRPRHRRTVCPHDHRCRGGCCCACSWWDLERAWLWAFVALGCAATAGGMALVVLESRADTSARDVLGPSVV